MKLRINRAALALVLVVFLVGCAGGDRSAWKPIDWPTETAKQANGFYKAVHTSYAKGKASLMESAKDARDNQELETLGEIMSIVVYMNNKIAPLLDEAKHNLDAANLVLQKWKAALNQDPNAPQPSDLLSVFYGARALIEQAMAELTRLGLK